MRTTLNALVRPGGETTDPISDALFDWCYDGLQDLSDYKSVHKSKYCEVYKDKDKVGRAEPAPPVKLVQLSLGAFSQH